MDRPLMPYVIAGPCIDVKDGAGVDVCPVDCIYTGGRIFYIQPDECIDCGVCLSVCPVAAIFEDHALPSTEARFTAINAEFLGPAWTGLGMPGGAGPAHRDHAGPPAGNGAGQGLT
jgi:ferredoxin